MELLLFTSSTCIPCIRTKEYYKKRGIPFTEVDIYTLPETAIGYGVRAIPTAIVIKRGTTDVIHTAKGGAETIQLGQYYKEEVEVKIKVEKGV